MAGKCSACGVQDAHPLYGSRCEDCSAESWGHGRYLADLHADEKQAGAQQISGEAHFREMRAEESRRGRPGDELPT